MNFRNALSGIFGGLKKVLNFTRWKEVGTYKSYFSSFGTDIYASELVRSCVRVLADHSSKASIKIITKRDGKQAAGDQILERMLKYRPNVYMNGADFISKVRTRYELDNTAFIYIHRDDYGKVSGFYPMPKANWEALAYGGQLYISFSFASGQSVVLPWADLAVLRKDYNESDIFGDPNTAILNSLELLSTANQGMANAIKSTANLRGILKSTKGMLDSDDVKAKKNAFVADYMNLTNEGGIAAMDGTMEFQAITMAPQMANSKTIEELRNNILRYFGMNEDILLGKVAGESGEGFYESKLEPFFICLGLELTYKVYTDRELGFGNEIIVEGSRIQYASTKAKLDIVQLIDRGIMTINEYREVLNLAPVDGGDVRVIRKEYAEANKLNEIQGVEDPKDDNSGQNL